MVPPILTERQWAIAARARQEQRRCICYAPQAGFEGRNGASGHEYFGLAAAAGPSALLTFSTMLASGQIFMGACRHDQNDRFREHPQQSRSLLDALHRQPPVQIQTASFR